MLESSGMSGIDEISRNMVGTIAVSHCIVLDTCILS